MKKNFSKSLTVILYSFLLGPTLKATNSIAKVRLGTDLCIQEKAFLQSRTLKVKRALEQIIGKPLTENQVPRIALCASGGGCRAALATLGWIQGMEIISPTRHYIKEILSFGTSVVDSIHTSILSWLGIPQSEIPIPNNNIVEPSPLSLLDVTTYLCSLSGSTWSVAGLQYSRMAPSHYLKTISAQLSQPIFADINVETIAKNLIKKHDYYNQPISFIDIYGDVLANKFLAGLGTSNTTSIDLTSYASLADTAQSPFPIHTAIFTHENKYEWIEFTPYEVGSTYLNAFIPTAAFGRKFNAGISTEYAPAQSLCYGMGIWGSAMSLNAKEFFNLVVNPYLETVSDESPPSQFSSIAAQAELFLTAIYNSVYNSQSFLLKDRISPAQVFNWTKEINSVPCNALDTLILTDAGFDINVAVPPALRPEREVDIIIILDSTRGATSDDFLRLESYVATHSLHMPKLVFHENEQICSIYQNETDAKAPIVIYMPLIKIPEYNSDFDPQTADFCSSLNFEYTQDQIDLLTGLTNYSMQQSKEIILNVLKEWIASRS